MSKQEKLAENLRNALAVIELEERQEMTVANEALCCGDNTSCNTSCTKAATTEAPAPAATT